MSEEFNPTAMMRAMMRALTMTKEDALKLESVLETEPTVFEPRLQLITHYMTHGSAAGQTARAKHLLWLIQNKPKHFILSSPVNFCAPDEKGQDHYRELKDAWLAQAKRYPRSISVLTNAATFFRFNDPHLSEELLLKAKEIDPNDMRVCLSLGSMYQQGTSERASGVEIAPQLDKAIEQYEDMAHGSPEQQFCALTSLVEAAGVAGDAQRVEELAPVLLEQANAYRDNWNYGNAIFHANFALAQTEYGRSNFSAAGAYLVKASQTPGSPQLDPGGPFHYDLVSKLLEKGERAAVKQFLQNLTKFWKDQGRVKKWIAEIDNNQIPDFDRERFDPEYPQARQ